MINLPSNNYWRDRNLKMIPINKVIAYLLLFNSLAIFSFFISPQLLSVNISEKLSFSAADGNCPTLNETVGKHCFGDFGLPIILIRDSIDVWNSDLIINPYTPGAMFIFRIFSHLVEILGSNFATLIYLILLFISAAIPLFMSLKNYGNITFRLFAALCLTLTSVPVLIALDRGSSVLFIIPFLYFSYVEFSKSHYPAAVMLLIFATTIRPQVSLFFLILLFNHKIKLFLLSIFGSVFTLTILFFLWSPALFLESISGWLKGVLIYGGWGLGSEWPNNYSAAQGINFFISSLIEKNMESTSIYISYILFGAYLIRLFFIRTSISISQSFLYLLPLLFLYPTTSWGYYPSVLVISLAILIITKEELKLNTIGMGSIFIGNFFCFLLALSLSSLYIPNSDLNNLVQKLVPSSWVIFIILILIKSFRIKKAEEEIK